MFCNQFDYLYPGWITGVYALAGFAIALISLIFILFLAILFPLIKKKRNITNRRRPSGGKSKKSVDHDELIRDIKTLNGKAASLLFAANSFRDLPVTVPVKIAVELAKTHTCLLIDLDTNRNAVSQVFGLNDGEMDHRLTVRSIVTDFEKLSVWPAKNFQLLKQMNVKQLIENASGKYDYILVYAPYLTTLPDRRQIASSCKHAFAFTGPNDASLMRLLEACNSNILREI